MGIVQPTALATEVSSAHERRQYATGRRNNRRPVATRYTIDVTEGQPERREQLRDRLGALDGVRRAMEAAL